MNEKDAIQHNINAHDRVADTYEQDRVEIYNHIEQQRLHDALGLAIESVRTGVKPVHALDVGCGAGNLTNHLLQHGCEVTASDVSKKCLQLVQERFGSKGTLHQLELNGHDMSNVPDNTYDMVATYSVLHHILDYLPAVAEMIRVLKPGGVLYIDHEQTAESWTPSPTYAEFLATVQPPHKKTWRRFFRWWNYSYHFHKLFNERYMPEGDIHVFADDHVEWDKVMECAVANNAEVVAFTPFLLFKRNYNEEVFRQYQNRCTDMAYLIVRKK